jgi:hypothetical protein
MPTRGERSAKTGGSRRASVAVDPGRQLDRGYRVDGREPEMTANVEDGDKSPTQKKQEAAEEKHPPPEEEWGGGDFCSIEQAPSTDDDQPLD